MAGGRWQVNTSRQRAVSAVLAKALAHATAIGATVVVAKLGRLTRNVDLLRSLVASDVDLVFCDLAAPPSRSYGTLPADANGLVGCRIGNGLISERIKAVLAAAGTRCEAWQSRVRALRDKAGRQQAGCDRSQRERAAPCGQPAGHCG